MSRMRREIWIVGGVLVLVAVVAWLLIAMPAQGQSTTPTDAQVNAVAKELWCPLCNGVRLDNCELQACVQMREVISEKLATGESKDNIKAYFVQQYGEVVLGMPKSPLPYILPPLLGVIALAWVIYFVVVWVRRRPAPTTAAGSVGPAQPNGDAYMKRVDEELEQYE
jgi:cytochrome c-type biogenesis protein CcmH